MHCCKEHFLGMIHQILVLHQTEDECESMEKKNIDVTIFGDDLRILEIWGMIPINP